MNLFILFLLCFRRNIKYCLLHCYNMYNCMSWHVSDILRKWKCYALPPGLLTFFCFFNTLCHIGGSCRSNSHTSTLLLESSLSGHYFFVVVWHFVYNNSFSRLSQSNNVESMSSLLLLLLEPLDGGVFRSGCGSKYDKISMGSTSGSNWKNLWITILSYYVY